MCYSVSKILKGMREWLDGLGGVKAFVCAHGFNLKQWQEFWPDALVLGTMNTKGKGKKFLKEFAQLDLQGLHGFPLWEEAVYDDQGTLVSGSFVDYTLPTTADTINFVTDRTTSPATSNDLGVKGVGEAGCIASTPAVVNAVLDAIRQFGVDDILMPCTPERVWRAIQDGNAGARSETAEDAAGHFAEGEPNQDDPGTTAGAEQEGGQA